jgi:hypothetical protein
MLVEKFEKKKIVLERTSEKEEPSFIKEVTFKGEFSVN